MQKKNGGALDFSYGTLPGVKWGDDRVNWLVAAKRS